MNFSAACATLRQDQANASLFAATATSCATVGAGLLAAGATIGVVPGLDVVGAGLILAGAVFVALAEIFTGLAFAASNDIPVQEGIMGGDMISFSNAVSAIESACCSDWIHVDLTPPSCP
jgi:hypothetical protein